MHSQRPAGRKLNSIARREPRRPARICSIGRQRPDQGGRHQNQQRRCRDRGQGRQTEGRYEVDGNSRTKREISAKEIEKLHASREKLKGENVRDLSLGTRRSLRKGDCGKEKGGRQTTRLYQRRGCTRVFQDRVKKRKGIKKLGTVWAQRPLAKPKRRGGKR